MMTSKGGRESTLQPDLIPVNAVIGFAKRDKRWPSALYDAGYKIAAIEQPISSGTIGSAEVDVITLNHGDNHAILWECKSGHSVTRKQAKVYAAATAEDVQRTGNVTFPNPGLAKSEAAYCCLEQDSAQIIEALRSFGLDVPVVVLGTRATLESGQFQDRKVQEKFCSGIDLPRLEEVPRFLPANKHTPKHKIAVLIIPTLVSFLRRQSGRISAQSILADTFPDWECMGTDFRRYLRETVKGIVADLCKNELKSFARTVRTKQAPGETFIEFTADVLGQDATSRTRTFQKLERLAYGYIDRSEQNRPFDPSREAESGWLPGFAPDLDD